MKTIELIDKQAGQLPYVAPTAEAFGFAAPHRLLVSFSAEAGFDDWEEAEGADAAL